MNEKKHIKNVIKHLEYYLTKDIEKNLAGYGDACYKYLEDILNECFLARKEINFTPLYDSIEEFLDACGYDYEFINEFLEKIANDDENPEDCPGW